jgi:hypothetical protein
MGTMLNNIRTGLSIYDLRLTVDLDLQLVVIVEDDPENLPVNGKIYLSSSVCQMLRIEENVKHRGGRDIIFTPGATFAMTNNISLDMNQHIALYCNILKNSIVGNQLCPLLHVLSARKIGLLQGTTDTIYYAPNLVFHPLGEH